MRYGSLCLLTLTLNFGLWGCHASTSVTTPRPAPTVHPQNTSRATEINYIPDHFDKPLGNNFEYVSDDALTYLDFEISKRVRRSETEIEYAVLKKGGKVVATFDGRPGQLSEVRFGLFPLLGEKDKQLVIEQTSNRYWRYWIVDLAPTFRVIYDSGKYHVIYDLRTLDADDDGRAEISQHLGTFWFFTGRFDNIYSPRQPILFEYDTRVREYRPANPAFERVVLKDAEQRMDKIREIKQAESNSNSTSRMMRDSAILDLMLRYIYAGKRQEAWSRYEQEYEGKDKKQFAAEIMNQLRTDSIYHKGTK